MRYIRLVMAICLFTGFSSTAISGGVNIKPGLWEFAYKTEIPGLPKVLVGKLAPRAERNCIHNKDEYFKPDIGRSQENCKAHTKQLNSHKHTWEMICKNGGIRNIGQGEFHFNSTTASGSFVVNTGSGDHKRPIVMKQSFTGKRIGACE